MTAPVFELRHITLGAAMLAAGLALSPHAAPGAPAGEAAARVITLAVDASEVTKKIVHTHETIPVTAGPLTLYYPKWIPGEHGPTGPLTGVVGLRLSAAGKPLTWRRDLEDMYAIHCDVPAGTGAVTVDFDMQTPQESNSFIAGASASAQLAVLNWNQHLLYPAGSPVADWSVAASLKIPPQWRAATALLTARAAGAGGTLEYRPVSLWTLVDSPVQMGAITRDVPLNPGEPRPVTLHLAADSRAALDMAPEVLAHYRALVTEARALFGARHYNEYHFLYTLSDHIASFGLEHHESSDDRDAERTLVDPDLRLAGADLLTHEYSHSWNGKYRRPADLTTPDFQQPMKGDLLWVYEGLTQYLGCLLAARSGLETAEQFRGELALHAARIEYRRGRDWRPLLDTAVEAQVLYEAPTEGLAWRRGTDFYNEGQLIWLEADAIIREKSGGQRSLDDFCRRFHGGEDSAPKVVTYTREDVEAALNSVAAYDWARFFRDRVDKIAEHAPLGGIEADGWRLAWRDSSSEYFRAIEKSEKYLNLEFSVGLLVNNDHGDAYGSVIDVIPGSPAAKAGIAPGAKLVAVNGRAWSEDVLHDAIAATAVAGGRPATPLELLVENAEFFRTCRLEYQGGGRYPWLERIAGTPDRLSPLIAAHAVAKP